MSKRKNKLVKIDELLEDIKYNEPTNEPPPVKHEPPPVKQFTKHTLKSSWKPNK